MNAFRDRYDDLSDYLVLDITSRVAGELGAVLKSRHMPAVVEALGKVRVTARLAQKEFASQQGQHAASQSSR